MGYERNDRRYGRDPSYGYRPQGTDRDYGRGYGRSEQPGYDRDREGRFGYRGAERGDDGRRAGGYDSDDRGFFDRAGDEVRSWFGDEDAERRRRQDERDAQRDYERGYGEREYGRETARGTGRQEHDPHYRSWRDRQMAEYDRDYEEYRRERQSGFDSDFGNWRTTRQGQRGSLSRVQEHQEVVGSDGKHVGTVDKVRGDRVILTRKDADAGGHHHSIPSSWITRVEDKVEISRTADQAHQHWKDEERNSAFGGDTNRDANRDRGGDANGPHALNRSFSGTY